MGRFAGAWAGVWVGGLHGARACTVGGSACVCVFCICVFLLDVLSYIHYLSLVWR